ncbi:MAG: c-type cytochrome, partial [Balneolaceae bacterium]|nr:c-type cytochrome [Balneolaceae bacterium]
MVLLAGILLWSGCGREKSYGDGCLSLYNSIDRSPGEDPGRADYESWADLKTPPLHPDEALERFQLEEGFRIELVASEPMVIDPIAMDIDADGRLWVINMPSYNRMPVREILETTGERTEEREAMLREKASEEVPEVKVVVLEDTDGDERMDKYRVFYEDVERPLAIKVLNDGVLVGEPPNLWFIRDTDGDGKGDDKELVSGDYGAPVIPSTQGGTNGLLWGVDNWIYSTHFPSLRRVDGRWQTRPFQRLGQWGLSQDNWGRLYSTHNSWPLHTHLVPYGYNERHPTFDVTEGIDVRIAPNKPLWPAHPTGVNRGYREGMLREDGTLFQATGIASTIIYRGGQYGQEYVGNAFTPEPAGNLIKRLIIDGDPAQIEAEARFAYEGREFLTSTDERFRPVNIFNAPDGSIYIVDMYRGLYDYLLFVTNYLRDYVFARDLEVPTGKFGRIWRIVRDDRPIDYDTPKLSEMTPDQTVELLKNPTGLLRDQAQQVLVQCSPSGVISSLESMVRDDSEQAWTRIQALWTLEGYDRSAYPRERLEQVALDALGDGHPRIRSSAVRILEPAVAENSLEILDRFERMAESEQAPYVRLQLLASLGESDSDRALQLMAGILDKDVESPYFREIALTGVYQQEDRFADLLQGEYGWNEERGESYASILNSLEEAVQERPVRDLTHLTGAQRKLYELGERRFATSCMACHGAEGRGIRGVGAALAGSDWVQGQPEALIRIVLQGFDGGAAERGENIPNEMPGHAFMSDEDLAGILTYIRQSWDNNAAPISPEQVARVRKETQNREELWSPDELRGITR